MKRCHIVLLLVGILWSFGCDNGFVTHVNLGDGSQSVEDEFISEAAIYGTVKDNYGEPVSGVIVSDGLLVTVTDENGHYELDSDIKNSTFVHITIPSAYQVISKSGLPQFFQPVPSDVGQFKADFLLMRRTGPMDRYTLFISADPQIRDRNEGTDNYVYHSIDIYEDLCMDMREHASGIIDRPVYGICLGDLVHNNMSLWKTYCNGLETLGFPTFNVIGNHDHIQNAANEKIAVSYYEKYIGPTNYAVDLGKMHFVFIDNIKMADNSGLTSNKTGNYTNGLSDEIMQWLTNHMKYVPKDKILMLCSHSSLYKKPSSNPSASDLNAQKYTALFADFKSVHSWAGHQHYNFNYAYAAEERNSRFANVESHILSRSTGMLGLNERVGSCGTPRGYLVVDVDGENMTWYWKPCDLEEGKRLGVDNDWQIKGYSPGEYYSDSRIYANVWQYDAYWGPVYYTDNGKSMAKMLRLSYYDGYARYLYTMWKDTYKSLEYVELPHIFAIDPSPGATSAKVETTDRFGNTYTTTIEW